MKSTLQQMYWNFNLDRIVSQSVWSPLGLATLAVLCLLIVNSVISRIFGWLAAREGSASRKSVGIATAALKQLRESNPELHPPTKHAWYGAQDLDIAAPLLCSVCVGAIPPLAPGAQLQSCSYCGIVAHDGCVRNVGDTCRPLSTPGPHPHHFWLAAGTTKEDAQGRPESGDGSEMCLYCGEQGTARVFGEPTWRCACCNAMAHVHCFCETHPQMSQVDAHFKQLVASSFTPKSPLCPIGHIARAGSTSEELGDADGEEEADGGELTQRQQMLQKAKTSTLDVCHLGHMGSVILSSSCVSPIASEGGNSGSAGTKTHRQSSRKRSNSGSKKAASKKGSWWRMLLGPAPPRWGDYRINGRLPPGIKPILVFINLNSGPRLGQDLYRQFLRMLHPLQVVALPREKPEPALRMFLHVPGLRILAVGGDGTVGWIMKCIETEIAAAEGEAAHVNGRGSPHHHHKQLKPPPVAVLPFGTGNDLARCLGWGGGWRTWGNAIASPSIILQEVVAASPVLIDRWEVSSAPLHAGEVFEAGTSPGADALQLKTTPRTSGKSSSSARKDYGAPHLMNNYVGIGIDAHVSLQFHRMRDAYPHWFSSQLGNKLGYTVLGAQGLVKGEVLNLAERVDITCDDKLITLPPGAEGVLILNINSWGGGVDAWSSGIDDAHAATPLGPQSIIDGKVEILAMYSAFHLGQLQVGLARAVKLAQGRRVVLKVKRDVPMHVDGEPFMQPPSTVRVQQYGHGLVLKRVQSQTVARVLQAVNEALDAAEADKEITPAQHEVLSRHLTAKLQPHL